MQDKINFTGSFYRNTSSDQLVGYQLSTVTGFSSVTANLPATVENKGWEFQLATRPLSGTLKWNSDFNISFPTNKFSAEIFGGGGHLNASGGESFTSLDESVKKFEEALPLYAEFL